MRTTPTIDRLIPLTDAVTANFRIAPIAINTKLEPILMSHPPSSDLRTYLSVTLDGIEASQRQAADDRGHDRGPPGLV